MTRRLAYVTLAAALMVAAAAWSGARAQDAVFSQFYAAPLLLNPAFAGTARAPSIALNHRSQYVGFAGTVPYQTYSVSYGQYLAPLRSGIGVSLFADDAGDNLFGTYGATAYYSYQVDLGDDNSVRVGMSAGAKHVRIDWDRLVFGDQLNANTGELGPGGTPTPTREQRPGETQTTYLDLGAGLLYAGRVAYLGVSADHLTTPDDRIASVGADGFYKGLPMRWSVHTGAQINLRGARARRGKEAFVTPNVLYARQGPFDQVNAGAYVQVGALFGGAWFRHAFGNGDAAIGVVGVEYGMYKFGYSYDYTVSALSQVSAGTHELSLQIDFEEAAWIKARRRNNRYNDCLNLFR